MFSTDLMNDSDFELKDEFFDMIDTVCAACAEHEQIGDAEVSVLFTTDEEIRELNAEYREKDAVTDVLSFPANDITVPLKNAMADGFEPERDFETGAIVLGDIAVSISAISRQAEEYGHSFEREAAFLCTHGMLHLMGYDHIEPEDEEIMRARQREILDKLNITRG